MNINNNYKKLRRQITSFPIGEIIETNSKYLEINSSDTLSNLFYGEYLGRHQKWIEEMNLHKKTSISRGLSKFY